MKTAQEARKGDRVWVKDAVTAELYNGTINQLESSGLDIWADGTPFKRRHDGLGTTWGYLADNEAVIGGVLVKPQYSGKDWLIDIYSIPTNSILGGGVAFTKCCDHFNLSDADKAAIREHVRRHSAPAPKPKRTAKDAKEGDKVWLLNRDNGEILDGLIQSCDDNGLIAIGSNGLVFSRYFDQFGAIWGFPESKPDDTTQALPVVEPVAKPNFNNVKLLIKTKGVEWVKANAPDAWRAYVAAQMQEVRQEGDKLAKPGILAGKTAIPWG